jgi:hypothetical protein
LYTVSVKSFSETHPLSGVASGPPLSVHWYVDGSAHDDRVSSQSVLTIAAPYTFSAMLGKSKPNAVSENLIVAKCQNQRNEGGLTKCKQEVKKKRMVKGLKCMSKNVTAELAVKAFHLSIKTDKEGLTYGSEKR